MLFAGVLLFGCAGTPELPGWYVAPDGDDANEGRGKTPLKTIAKALEYAQPGDTIFLREGDYHEFVVPTRSGESGKNITIKSYPGETARIDGTGLKLEGWMALVQLRDIKNMTLENLHICNAENAVPNSDPEGIYINGKSSNITIRGCKVYNIKNVCLDTHGKGDWRSAHAILALGTSNEEPIRNLIIEQCEIYDMHTGTSEIMTLAGNIDGFTVQDNYVHDVENIGIIVAGGDNLNPSGDPAVNYARNGVVRRNKVHRCTHQYTKDFWERVCNNPAAYGAIGIYVCGGGNTVIEQNEVWECDRAIGLVSESDILSTKNCIVRNNLIYNNYRTGIYMGDYIGYTIGGTYNCQIVNNTLFNNNQVGGALNGSNNQAGVDDAKDSEGEIRLTENCFDNVIMNNVIYALTDRDIFIRKYTTTGARNRIGHNIYYSPNNAVQKWFWDGTEYTDFAAWQAASGDENSVYGVDPLLKNANAVNTDLRLTSESAAKNAGCVLELSLVGELDMDGKARVQDGKISIGAYQ